MGNEIISLEKVLHSNIFVKENRAFSFAPPETYIRPFLDIVEKVTPEFKVTVAEQSINLDPNSKEENIAYAKVLIEAALPIFADAEGENHIPTFGLVYSLNGTKPVIKTYYGYNVKVCTNLTIFGADKVVSNDLFSTNFKTFYDKINGFVDGVEKDQIEYKKIISALKELNIDRSGIYDVLGNIREKIYRNKLVLGISHITQAERLLYSPDSRYYVGHYEETGTSLWNIYNAISQTITDDTNIVDKANKTVILSELFQTHLK